ncbi:uroporphyrinogen decarboxylase family protein [Dictyobacter aurantiacus]|uniref:Uroporphyrinogen decarboxylase n=1 Tax=Dictyobacter aurantiacus TaxID=1936993 RepID=A0A401ZAF7_9CHLR|nr:uroporphyrinogen decarboxylase family protein [Dictyobacter aurantiacus]GCE03861.1 uroporphyrinogen decarboxylase [Dictyobacter aurantiacus]
MPITMTTAQRVRAALRGEPVDRVPLCFWHHFRPQGSGERLAEETFEFFKSKFDLDIVKIMPDLPYPEPEEAISDVSQFQSLPQLDLDTPVFQEQLRCIRTLRMQLGPDYPLILTLFSPLTYLFNFMGENFSGKQRVIEGARQQPAAIEKGLAIVAANLQNLMRAAIEAGASGIFFSCMGATSADFTPEEYRRIARPYDLEALKGAQGGWLNIVHIHAAPSQDGDDIHFEQFTDYPVSVLSWSDRVTGPELSEAMELTSKCLMGGLWERGPLTHGSETEIENEILSAITQTKGHRLILANGCSIPDDTSEEPLHIVRRLVDQLS